MKILQVEDGGGSVCGDELQRGLRIVSAGDRHFAVAGHALGEAPRPDGDGRTGGEAAAGVAQGLSGALFFGGVDVGERAAGFEDFAKGLGGAALRRLGPRRSFYR